MRTFALILLLGVVCQCKRWDNAGLLDLLKRYEVPPPPEVRIARIENSSPAPSDEPNNEMNTSPPDNWSNKPFEGIEEAFLFPGSHYLTRLIVQYFEYREQEPMEAEEMIDHFELPECDMKDLVRNLHKIYKMLYTDPEDVAVLATRTLIKPILMERMKCPAAVWDMGIIKSMMRLKNDFIQKEDDSLYQFFRDIVPLLDPKFQPYADDIAKRFVEEFHGFIFNETIEYLVGLGFRDVAFASHHLYDGLLNYFLYSPTDMSYNRDMELKNVVQFTMWDVRCPNSKEVIENHKRMIWRFRDVFGMIESERVCPRVVDFLYKYVNMKMPAYIPNFEANSNLHVVCEAVKETIDGIVEGFTEYENALSSMNIGDMEKLLKEALGPEDWNLLEEALRRLGFMEMFI